MHEQFNINQVNERIAIPHILKPQMESQQYKFYTDQTGNNFGVVR